jgi:threonylcarbamoyladenosine tRNA methylthiotransferase CDKAL1
MDVDIEDSFQEFAKEAERPVRDATVNVAGQNSSSLKTDIEADVPEAQKVWIKTYGCSHNASDSEYMHGLLVKYGYQVVEERNAADVWLVNSCTVKDPSQAAFMNVVHQAKEQEKPIVVAGCVSQAQRTLQGLEDVSIVGVTQIDRIVEAVEETLHGNTVKMLAKKELPKLDLPKIRRNPLVEIIPLSTGCLGACTYCKTREARGKLGSYAQEALVDRVKQVIGEGVSEIWLTSEDTGAYGLDIGTNIVKLLRNILEVIPPQGVMLRVGMTNPPYILEHLSDIAEILNDDRVYAFLHVPVQAGSNRVLLAMNREYTAEDFRLVADTLLAKVPGMTIATDIICGFPSEDEHDFDYTLSLIGHYQFAITNISQFYPRPGTPAAKMKRVPTNIVKDRSRRLTKVFESIVPYTYMVGQTVKVWFDVEVSDDRKYSVGHTKAYIKILVPLDESLPGRCYLVKIESAARFHCVGSIVSLVNLSNREMLGQNKTIPSRASTSKRDTENIVSKTSLTVISANHSEQQSMGIKKVHLATGLLSSTRTILLVAIPMVFYAMGKLK